MVKDLARQASCIVLDGYVLPLSTSHKENLKPNVRACNKAKGTTQDFVTWHSGKA